MFVQGVMNFSELESFTNFGKAQQKMGIVSTVSPENSIYKTTWEYDWPLPDQSDNTSRLLLKVDESSSESEIEDEIEYWMDEIRVFGLQDPHKKAIMSAINWMTTLLS